jgi:hypothetical protein
MQKRPGISLQQPIDELEQDCFSSLHNAVFLVMFLNRCAYSVQRGCTHSPGNRVRLDDVPKVQLQVDDVLDLHKGEAARIV